MIKLISKSLATSFLLITAFTIPLFAHAASSDSFFSNLYCKTIGSWIDDITCKPLPVGDALEVEIIPKTIFIETQPVEITTHAQPITPIAQPQASVSYIPQPFDTSLLVTKDFLFRQVDSIFNSVGRTVEDLQEDINNVDTSGGGGFSDLSSFDTDDLAEGSNQYFTNARVGSYISGSSTIPHIAGSAYGDLLFWNNSSWSTIATSSLGITGGGYGDTNLNSYIHASTTLPKTYTANIFSALQTFGSASTTMFTSIGNTYLATVSGNVGVGTTSPYSKLSVTGDTAFNGNLTVTGTTTSNGLVLNSNKTFYIGSEVLIDSAGNLNATVLPLQDVAGNLSAVVPASGERIYETDTGYSKVGDGVTSAGNLKPLNPWSANGTSLYYSAGNVGIGTTSPYAKLSVAGHVVGQYFTATSTATASTFSGQIQSGKGIQISGTTEYVFNGGPIESPIWLNSNADLANTFVIAAFGNDLTSNDYGEKAMSINWDGPTRRFSIGDGEAIYSSCFYNGTTCLVSSQLTTSGSDISYTTGKVGIGTTSPYAKLSVAGTIVGQNFVATSTTATNYFAGNVGIGIQPTYPLHVNGNIKVEDGSVIYAPEISSSDDVSAARITLVDEDIVMYQDTTIFPGTVNAFSVFRADGVTRALSVDGITGNIGFNTNSAPGRTLTVNGSSDLGTNALAGSFTATSTTATSTFAGFIDVLGTGSNATSTFSSNLWVKGTLRTGTGSLYLNDTSINAANRGFSINTTGNSFVNGVSGNFGIGTTSPYAKLSVAGTIVGQNFVATSTTATSTFSSGVSIANALYVTGKTLVGAAAGGADSLAANEVFRVVGGNGGENAQNGFAGGGMSLIGGLGGFFDNSISVNGFGGKGGTINITGGAGGYITETNYDYDHIGGAGGDLIFSAGAGGGVTNGNNGNAGNGGNIILSPGVGGIASGWANDGNDGLDGKVGIASSTPWKTLSVTGTVAINGLAGSTGAGSICLTASKELVYNSGSDACLPSLKYTKKDIENLSVNALSLIEDLQPATFVYKEGDQRVRYGFIAEDTKEIDEHLVTYNAEGDLSGIDDRAMTSLLIKAMKELKLKIDVLESSTSTSAISNAGIWNFITSQFSGIVVSIKDLVSETITAAVGSFKKVKVSEGIEIKDSETGDIYCLTIKSGETHTEEGECGESDDDLNEDNNDNTNNEDDDSNDDTVASSTDEVIEEPVDDSEEVVQEESPDSEEETEPSSEETETVEETPSEPEN